MLILIIIICINKSFSIPGAQELVNLMGDNGFEMDGTTYVLTILYRFTRAFASYQILKAQQYTVPATVKRTMSRSRKYQNPYTNPLEIPVRLNAFLLNIVFPVFENHFPFCFLSPLLPWQVIRHDLADDFTLFLGSCIQFNGKCNKVIRHKLSSLPVSSQTQKCKHIIMVC